MGIELGDRNAHMEGFLEAVLPEQEGVSTCMMQAAHWIELLLFSHSMLPLPWFIVHVLEYNKIFIYTRLGLHQRTSQAYTPPWRCTGWMDELNTP